MSDMSGIELVQLGRPFRAWYFGGLYDPGFAPLTLGYNRPSLRGLVLPSSGDDHRLCCFPCPQFKSA